MSEAMTVPPLTDGPAKRTPTVYFIDDSATMREVIKIAFRRENIHVVTCADAASAFAQFDQSPPDAVITDVIMPDQDGYSVCTQVKQHPRFGKVPVILMSGIVNKSVADKAVSVQADELIRKPFQPQELIGRVKSLLAPKTPPASSFDRLSSANTHRAPSPLTGLFAPPPTLAQTFVPPTASVQPDPHAPDFAWPRALAEAFNPRPTFSASGLQPGQPASADPATQSALLSGQHSPLPPQSSHLTPHSQTHATTLHPGQAGQSSQAPSQPQARSLSAADTTKLRAEIARLELLVKKLQSELQIERQYNQALELQIHTLTHTE
jgi:twitching motility two-component system response regulator PilH